MSNPTESHGRSLLHFAGVLVFVFLCAVPALEMNGFGFGIPLTLPEAFACAAIGGVVGKVLICPQPMVGGLLAGPLGLIAVYFYSQHRQQIWDVEVMDVQCLASLPGLGVGWLLKKMLSEDSPKAGAGDSDLFRAETSFRREDKQ